MVEAGLLEERVVELIRHFSAPPERVFRALTEVDRLRLWFGPPGTRLGRVEVDLRVGGRYLIEMIGRESGKHFVVSGQYKEIDPPHRIVISWRWIEGGPDEGETQVTFELKAEDAGTRLRLRHEGFTSDENRDSHEQGWSSGIDKIASALD